MILYLDTSALVKLYVQEEHREDVRRAVRAAEVVAISEIGFVEARSAFARREREGTFSEEGHDREVRRLRRDFDEGYLVCPVTAEVVARAGVLARKHALRAYDAVHLATALALRDEAREVRDERAEQSAENEEAVITVVELLTYDSPLAEAARKEGVGRDEDYAGDAT